MPTITQEEVKAFAHCVSPRCAGYQEQEVDAVREEAAFTYAERGGDLGGTESSFVNIRFADDKQLPCPYCGGHRDLSASPRRAYAALSGFDPDGLLEIQPYDPAKQAAVLATPPSDAERQKFEAERQALQDEMIALRAQLAEAKE